MIAMAILLLEQPEKIATHNVTVTNFFLLSTNIKYKMCVIHHKH